MAALPNRDRSRTLYATSVYPGAPFAAPIVSCQVIPVDVTNGVRTIEPKVETLEVFLSYASPAPETPANMQQPIRQLMQEEEGSAHDA